VHIPDPFSPSSVLRAVAARLAPGYRVLSLSPRGGVPYQVSCLDLLATLDQFGFMEPVLVGERLGNVPALVLAAWYARARGLILVDPIDDAPPGDSIEARAVRDCPPDWARLHDALRCPARVLRSDSDSVIHDIEAFVASLP